MCDRKMTRKEPSQAALKSEETPSEIHLSYLASPARKLPANHEVLTEVVASFLWAQGFLCGPDCLYKSFLFEWLSQSEFKGP